MRTATVAAVQATPVFLDRTATLERCVRLIEEATAAGAELVVFPEAFVPGYPDWVWRTRPWDTVSTSFYRRLFDQAVEVPGPMIQPVADAARAAGAFVVLGVNERGGSTLYNSLVYLGPTGEVLGVHRKLMPTGGERLVWGSGDGSGLVAVDTPFGRVGGLICWENYMPLARAAVYADDVDIFVAPTWDNSDGWVPTLRHIAREGRVHVIGTNSFLRGSDVPADEHGAQDLYGGDDDWMSRGNASIVSPDGDLLAGPLVGEAGILYATVDAAAARAGRQQFDPVGHYARPDVFRLTVDRRAAPFSQDAVGAAETPAPPSVPPVPLPTA
ncbi:MAG: carbon-nitrogen hydrolase family protein [Acidimicrobiales bacterium]|nr:carbon-nitrogen hydrolase family protein [Acidimicrobiales bacterium]